MTNPILACFASWEAGNFTLKGTGGTLKGDWPTGELYHCNRILAPPKSGNGIKRETVRIGGNAGGVYSKPYDWHRNAEVFARVRRLRSKQVCAILGPSKRDDAENVR